MVYGVSWSKLDTGGNVMKPSTTTAITTVKHQMKLREWAEQIEAMRASGMTVQSWCAENGMNVKTYYYHLLYGILFSRLLRQTDWMPKNI